MKRYIDDTAKEKSRQLLKTMIEDTLLRFMRPQNITVLHLPGPDGMEYKQVYGPLGIPPENVIGIEEDPETAHFARKNNPGIKIENTTLENYLNDNRSFNRSVLSIDTTGNCSLTTLNTAMSMGLRNSAGNFVYHLAVQKRRESSKSQKFMDRLAGHLEFSHAIGTWEVMEKIKGQEIDALRDSGLTYVLLTVTTGAEWKNVVPVFKRTLGSDYRKVIDKVIYWMDEHDPDRNFERTYGELIKGPNFNFDSIPYSDFIMMIMKMYTNERLAKILHHQIQSAQKKYSTIDVSNLVRILTKRVTDGIFYSHMGKVRSLNELKRYAYISESGTPMIGDIAYFRDDKRILQAYSDLVEQFTPGNFIIKDYVRLEKCLRRLTNLTEGLKFKEIPDYFTQREYLGSSAKPILRKAKAIELLRSGMSLNDINSSYRGMNRRSLGALKAHVTMGTYESMCSAHDEASRMELKEDIETKISLLQAGVHSTGEERLDKADILVYLSSGVPPIEIKEAYPGTSLPRVYALDHWRKKKNH